MAKTVLVRATPYRCTHWLFGIPYWTHRAYELEIVGHGHTMAPSKRQIRPWAADWLGCNYDNDPNEWEVMIECN